MNNLSFIHFIFTRNDDDFCHDFVSSHSFVFLFFVFRLHSTFQKWWRKILLTFSCEPFQLNLLIKVCFCPKSGLHWKVSKVYSKAFATEGNSLRIKFEALAILFGQVVFEGKLMKRTSSFPVSILLTNFDVKLKANFNFLFWIKKSNLKEYKL